MAFVKPRRGHFLLQRLRASLRTIPADAEQHVDLLAFEKIDHDLGRLRTARTAQDRAAQIVNPFDKLRSQVDRRVAVLRIQAAKPYLIPKTRRTP